METGSSDPGAESGRTGPSAWFRRKLGALLGDRAGVTADDGGRLDPPLAEAPLPAPAPAFAVYRDDGDQYWRPLIDPLMVLGGVWRSKKLILATTVAGALIAVAVALSTPKKYDATAELLVDPRELKIVERDLTATALPSDGTLAIVENQARVLVSGNVLTRVVDELNLAADPEFNGQAGGFSIRGLVSELRSILTRAESGGVGAEVRRILAINNLAESLHVARSENTFIITVTASTRDAEKSAIIANKLTEVFLQTYGAIQAGTAGRATDELTSRLDELRAGVEAAERAVEAFKAENDIVDAQGRLITDDEIVKLNDQLSTARARTIELNARVASARGVDLDAVLAGALPEQVASPVMTALRAQYSMLKQEVDRLSVRLGPRHPQRLSAEAQLEGAREQLQVELRRIVQSVQVELQRAMQQEQDLAARLAQLKAGQANLNEELVTLRELERDASSKRSIYESYLLRARETGEQQTLNTANVSVISQATPPLLPSGASRAATAVFGTILGFLAGVGLGAARGAMASLRESGRLARNNLSPGIPRLQDDDMRHSGQTPSPQPRAGQVSSIEPSYMPYHGRQQPLHPPVQASFDPHSAAGSQAQRSAHGLRYDDDHLPPRPYAAALFDDDEWLDEAPAAASLYAGAPRPIDDIREHLREVRDAVRDLAAYRSARRPY